MRATRGRPLSNGKSLRPLTPSVTPHPYAVPGLNRVLYHIRTGYNAVSQLQSRYPQRAGNVSVDPWITVVRPGYSVFEIASGDGNGLDLQARARPVPNGLLPLDRSPATPTPSRCFDTVTAVRTTCSIPVLPAGRRTARTCSPSTLLTTYRIPSRSGRLNPVAYRPFPTSTNLESQSIRVRLALN